MNDTLELKRTKEFIRKKIEDTYLPFRIETDEGSKNGWTFGDSCCFDVDFNDSYPLEIRLNDYCDIEINDPLDFLLWNKEFFCADEMDVKEIKAVEINECMKLIGNRIQMMQ